MRNSKQKGYSIIEMVVYLSIFAIMSVVVINSFIVILKSFNTSRINRNLLESGSIAMERIGREIRETKTINVANSTFGTNPGILQLDSLNVTGYPDSVIRFVVSNGALNIYENGVLIGNLLGQNVTVSSLIFRRMTNTNSEAIKIEMTLQTVSGNTTRLENFYSTVVLRGLY